MTLSRVLASLLGEGEPVILVTVAEARGSTPREAGAAMLVTYGGSHGTVGGGGLEYHAIDVARAMLARDETARELDLPLGPLLGQCCGGRVRLSLEAAEPRHVATLAGLDRDARAAMPAAIVFGCGHTGRALARALAPLPFRVSLVDDRLEPFEPPVEVTYQRLDDPADAVAAARPSSAFVVMTHSHALDYRLAEAALRRGDAAYLGLIGSATKRARFERAFLANGGSAAALAGLTCPIGGADVDDKRPEVIAALTAAELVRVFGSCELRLPSHLRGGPSRSEAEDRGRGGGRRAGRLSDSTLLQEAGRLHPQPLPAKGR